MRTQRNLGLAMLLCAAAAACGEDTGTRATAAGPLLAVVPPACVEFGPPPPAGTVWGSPVGHVPGQVVHAENSIRVAVVPFHFMGGGGAFNFAQLNLPPVVFANGQAANTNNINLQFDFTNLGWAATRVYFSFLDQGGHENLSVNLSPFYIGELTAAPAVVGGRNVNVAWGFVPGGKAGTVRIWGGTIKHVTVGGQEFWIDKVCAEP
jgi:hypothetical protein